MAALPRLDVTKLAQPCSNTVVSVYLTRMARWGHTNSDYLFWTQDFRAVQEHLRERMRQAIDQAAPETIRNGSVDDVAQIFAAQFRVEPPALTEGAISATVDETKVDVSRDRSLAFMYGAFEGGPHYVPGITASFYVPFVGDAEMFKWKPSTFTTVIPAAEIKGNELLFRFVRPGEDVADTKKAFDEELSRVKQYLGWLTNDAEAFNQSLVPTARGMITQRRGRLEKLDQGTDSLGIPIRRATSGSTPATVRRAIHPTTTPPSGRSGAAPRSSPQYDVALSFAGENRAYVEEVATGLRAAGVSVFYDGFEKANLWGKNLVDHLADIYQNKSRYVVMFISQHYVEKAWTKHERQHAQARSLIAKDEYILPARFDDTDVPGLANTVGHVNLQKMAPAELVELILAKLGKRK